MNRLVLTLLMMGGLVTAAQGQSNQGFERWKADFSQQAAQKGVSSSVLEHFKQQVRLYPDALRSDKDQAEFKKFLWQYLDSAISTTRVSNGREKYRQNTTILNRVARQTGVPAQIITAIWGMESSYGGYTGTVPIFNSMATLAYDGRRRVFFENELIAGLKLLANGDLPSLSVKGSWAGGLGMTQFIPTTYQRYAVDYNGDGRRNLWQVGDALASTGNYLSQMGWINGYRWGREVSLARGFDYFMANDPKRWKSLNDWGKLGVRSATGEALPQDNIQARLFVPAGQNGPKFLLYKNFDVIKRYNNSDAYALGVSLLSERIAGRPGLVARWPQNAKKLRKQDVKAVQQILNKMGFDAGSVDGVFGNGTRRALQSYQAVNDMVADGFLSNELFRQLMNYQ